MNNFLIASQEDSALVKGMAEQALQDIPVLEVLLEAGCSQEEARAVMNQEAN